MSLLLSSAHAAQAAGNTQSGGNPMGSVIMLVGFAVIFYFLLWRPQSKRAKEHRELVSSLQKGDEVVTNGGLYAKINKVTDDALVLLIADGVEVKLQKNAISSVLPKGTLKSV